MTPPDFPALAREWISYCLARTEPWTEDEEAAALAERFRAVHAAGREAGVREAAEVCEREARACHHHANAFLETKSKARIPLHRAHAMAGHQNSACAHYILALLPEPKP